MVDFSPTGKFRVWTLTALGTAVCVALAFAIDGYSTETGEWGLNDRWINNAIIPLLVAPPFFFFLLSKLRELSLAHRELLKVASNDPLTDCLNRRAFSTLIEAYLDRLDVAADRRIGALLVLDVDNFKSVNDRFGHDVGDQALKLIADVIKTNVRELDLVARLGGEEFGVFLPGADPVRTSAVAERIRLAVQASTFRPTAEAYPLSLSIGGISFKPPTTFQQLYKLADERLYAAKHAGRNRVIVDMVAPSPGMSLA